VSIDDCRSHNSQQCLSGPAAVRLDLRTVRAITRQAVGARHPTFCRARRASPFPALRKRLRARFRSAGGLVSRGGGGGAVED